MTIGPPHIYRDQGQRAGVPSGIVEAAIECKMVHERAVIYFGDVPHAQIVKF